MQVRPGLLASSSYCAGLSSSRTVGGPATHTVEHTVQANRRKSYPTYPRYWGLVRVCRKVRNLPSALRDRSRSTELLVKYWGSVEKRVAKAPAAWLAVLKRKSGGRRRILGRLVPLFPSCLSISRGKVERSTPPFGFPVRWPGIFRRILKAGGRWRRGVRGPQKSGRREKLFFFCCLGLSRFLVCRTTEASRQCDTGKKKSFYLRSCGELDSLLQAGCCCRSMRMSHQHRAVALSRSSERKCWGEPWSVDAMRTSSCSKDAVALSP